MKGFFNFHKSEKPSFDKKKECLEQIKFPDTANELVSISDEIQSGYDDPRWINKSNSIKARDNYTCQLCHAFNPMLGGPVFIQQGDYKTYHIYTTTNFGSTYVILIEDYDFTINFEFYPGYHLAIPRLNVHHKVYYRNRNLWDYKEDCLVTLCEDCHHYIHSLNDITIPIVEENSVGQTIFVEKIRPKPYLPRLDHTDLGTFQPLSLVKENRWGDELEEQDITAYKRAKRENKKWYDYCKILDNKVIHIFVLSTRHFPFNDLRSNKYTLEEINKVADFIIQDFIENILGFRKK